MFTFPDVSSVAILITNVNYMFSTPYLWNVLILVHAILRGTGIAQSV